MTKYLGSGWWPNQRNTGSWWTLFLPYHKWFCELVRSSFNPITVFYVSSSQRTSAIRMANPWMTSWMLKLCSPRKDPPLHVDLNRGAWRMMLCSRCVFFSLILSSLVSLQNFTIRTTLGHCPASCAAFSCSSSPKDLQWLNPPTQIIMAVVDE